MHFTNRCNHANKHTTNKQIYRQQTNKNLHADAITSLIVQTKIKIMIKVILGGMQQANFTSWLSSSNAQLPPI